MSKEEPPCPTKPAYRLGECNAGLTIATNLVKSPADLLFLNL